MGIGTFAWDQCCDVFFVGAGLLINRESEALFAQGTSFLPRVIDAIGNINWILTFAIFRVKAGAAESTVVRAVIVDYCAVVFRFVNTASYTIYCFETITGPT